MCVCPSALRPVWLSMVALPVPQGLAKAAQYNLYIGKVSAEPTGKPGRAAVQLLFAGKPKMLALQHVNLTILGDNDWEGLSGKVTDVVQAVREQGVNGRTKGAKQALNSAGNIVDAATDDSTTWPKALPSKAALKAKVAALLATVEAGGLAPVMQGPLPPLPPPAAPLCATVLLGVWGGEGRQSVQGTPPPCSPPTNADVLRRLTTQEWPGPTVGEIAGLMFRTCGADMQLSCQGQLKAGAETTGLAVRMMDGVELLINELATAAAQMQKDGSHIEPEPEPEPELEVDSLTFAALSAAVFERYQDAGRMNKEVLTPHSASTMESTGGGGGGAVRKRCSLGHCPCTFPPGH